MSDPAPAQMLLEACQDAVEAFNVLRIGLRNEPKAIEVIDAHIDELNYAIAAATPINVSEQIEGEA